MITEVTLPSHCFSDEKLKNLKRVNFIYGKNGTGKTSLIEAIKNEYEENYDLRIFQGFDSVIADNHGFNAIALGKENSKLQPQIDKQQEEVDRLYKDTTDSSFKDGAFSIFNETKKDKEQSSSRLSKFYTDSAKDIKFKENSIAGPNYNKLNFKDDIEKAVKLSKDEIKVNDGLITQKQIDVTEPKDMVSIDLKKLLSKVDEIRETAVTESALISFKNQDSQNWAKVGMEIHKQSDGSFSEKCEFCGNEISEIRIHDLNSFFNEEVKKLEKYIDIVSGEIQGYLNILKTQDNIDVNKFYPQYVSQVNELNLQISTVNKEYMNLLNELLEALVEKKNNIFKILESVNMNTDISERIREIKSEYLDLYDTNMKFSSSLDAKRSEAREKLRLHYVALKVESSEYKSLCAENLVNTQKMKEAQTKLIERKRDFSSASDKLNSLLKDTKNEDLAADNINSYLKSLGTQSFKMVKKEDDKHEGLYTITDLENNERDIDTLSTGEKNIVAFLWFIYNLKNTDQSNNKEKIVLFDDPMNSNDDASQYLMIGILQELYSESSSPQIFILTHNNHFYLQVKPFNDKYDKKAHIKFQKNSKKTEIKMISNKNEDLNTIYDELWQELIFAYNKNKVIFMWNNMRRILETYNRFVYGNTSPREIEKQFDNFEDKATALALVKSLNVNSHVGYETDVDISSKTKDNLKNLFEVLFDKLNASEHFEKYWNGNQE